MILRKKSVGRKMKNFQYKTIIMKSAMMLRKKSVGRKMKNFQFQSIIMRSANVIKKEISGKKDEKLPIPINHNAVSNDIREEISGNTPIQNNHEVSIENNYNWEEITDSIYEENEDFPSIIMRS